MANEVRLIDANALQNLLLPIAMGLEKEYGSLGGAVSGVMQHIDAAPTIDPESLRPKGRWVDEMVRDWRCSECGNKVPKQVFFDGYCYDDKLNYCPNCGAKMEA